MDRIVSFAKGSLACTCLHLKRCLGWRLVDVEPSVNEGKKIGDSGSNACAVMRSYLVWRRSSMLVSLPIMLYSTMSGFAEFNRFRQEISDDVYQYSTTLGVVLIILPSFAEAMLFLTVVVALVRWHKWRNTSKLLMVGWTISTMMPLLPALVPSNFTTSEEYKPDFLAQCFKDKGFLANGENSEICKLEYEAAEWEFRILQTIWYGMQILPLVLTIPSSAVRGALRIRGLLPDSSLTSWVIMISAPFHSLLIFVTVVSIIQMAGDVFLIAGSVLLCFIPWLFVFRRELYVSVSTEVKEKKIDKNHKIMLALSVVSYILLTIWAVTENSLGVKPLGTVEEYVEGRSLRTYNSFFTLVFEGIGRLLITTTVFSDALLRMTVTFWRHENSRRESEATFELIEDIFNLLKHDDVRSEPATLDEMETESDMDVESNDTISKTVTNMCLIVDAPNTKLTPAS